MPVKIPFLDLGAIHADLAIELNEVWWQVMSSGKFIGGEFVDRFEAEWALYCGVRYCVGVSSGTSALELVLKALGIEAGDEVIVPANTFIATATAVVAASGQPVSRILSLPMFPNIHDSQIRRVAEVIDGSLKELERSSLVS